MDTKNTPATARKREKSAAASALGQASATGRRARRSPAPAGLTKKSVSMPSATAKAIEELAGAEGISVSAWLTRAAEESAERTRRLADGRAAAAELLAGYEAENGALPEQAVLAARAFLNSDHDVA